jgi:hypothetical protein
VATKKECDVTEHEYQCPECYGESVVYHFGDFGASGSHLYPVCERCQVCWYAGYGLISPPWAVFQDMTRAEWEAGLPKQIEKLSAYRFVEDDS